MKRKDFIKRSALAGFALTAFANKSFTPGDCKSTPGETAGPFPTHHPETLAVKNIIAGKAGVPLTIRISVNNINNKCNGLKDAVIDIWHCVNKGEYSEYGGKNEHGKGGGPGLPPPGGRGMPPQDWPGKQTDSLHKKDGRPMPPSMDGMGGGMQAADHTKEHFLRGRQHTNANGEVAFLSVYPGWYPGRAPHVHVQIHDKNGKSLLVTQIAFPEDSSNAVYAQGVYALHGHPDTSNATDNVFNDSIANELGTLTGNIADGFVLTHAIYVKA